MGTPYRECPNCGAHLDAGTYDPGATLCFQPEDVEEIEVLCEEIVPEPQTATPPPRTPKKKRRKRRRK